MPEVRQNFRVALLELFGVLTLAALACFAIANATPTMAHVVNTVACLIIMVAFSLIPCTSGARQRFLIVFVGTAGIYQLFHSKAWDVPFEAVVEQAHLLVSWLQNKEADAIGFGNPRGDRLIAFREVMHPILNLVLPSLFGLLASYLPPPRATGIEDSN